MMQSAMRFGIFLAPFHALNQNPTLALERDLELVEHLDRLGYDEAWIGEHHSAGHEIIASPEVFIGVASQRTRHIKLGTGVSSLPYHHPLILLDRMILLDHLTRGRVMLGVGPGSLPSDAHMMGMQPVEQRRMMEESVEAMLALLESDEPVNRETDWFTLRDARLQLRPYTKPCFEIAAAATFSPAGPRLAGRFGLSLLSIGATSVNGFDVISSAWPVVEDRATEYGRTANRRDWRLVGPMHIAETAEQARHDVKFGMTDFARYFQISALFGVKPASNDVDDVIDAMISSGFAVIGTPDQATAQIERLQRQSGGFGAFLFLTHEWANRVATLNSYELFARYVMPRFQGSLPSLEQSFAWTSGQREQFREQTGAARLRATAEHQADEAAKAGLAQPTPVSASADD